MSMYISNIITIGVRELVESLGSDTGKLQ